MERSQWEVELEVQAEADFHQLILGIMSLLLCINSYLHVRIRKNG
jgi:hypothetical protein